MARNLWSNPLLKRGHDPFFPVGLPPTNSERSPSSAHSQGFGPGHLGHQPRALPAPTAPVFPPAAVLFKAFRQRAGLGLALGLIAATLAGVTAWKVLPKSRFIVKNMLEIKSIKPVLLLETVQERTDFKSFQSTQLALINSPLVLEAALKRPGIVDLPTVKVQTDRVDWLKNAILTSFPNGPELLEVSMTGARGDDLVPIVNAVTDAYLEEVVEKDERDRQTRIANLKNLYDQGEHDLEARRAERRRLAEKVGSDDRSTLSAKHTAIFEELTFHRNERVKAATERRQAEAELAVLKESQLQTPRTIDPSELEPYLANDNELENSRIAIQKAKLRADRARASARGGEDVVARDARRIMQAETKAYNKRLAMLTPRIESKIRSLEGANETHRIAELESRIKSLLNYESQVDLNISRCEAESKNFNTQTLDLDAINSQILQKEETHQKIGQQLEALNIEMKAPDRFREIERSLTAKAENPNKRLMAILMVALAAFGASVSLVTWREYVQRRLDSPIEIIEGLGLRLVGVLPQLPTGRPKESNGRALPGTSSARWQNLLIESIDAARTVLLHDSRNRPLRTIMVTSASKGEGKSSLASHLATSLARTGRRTLLVDLDLRSPTLHHLFDLEKGPGVSEVLRGDREVYQAVQPVMTDLDVLTAGTISAESIRALGQDTLPQLMKRLTEQYDLIIIDTPPVLPVADALLISGHTDAVILSVFRDVSKLPAVVACKERLEVLGIRLLGVVMTGIPIERFGPEYSYAGRPETFA